MIIIINDLVLIIMFKYERKHKKNTILNTNQVNIEKSIQLNKNNIGNALIMLNNLINICEKIKCKNIICPKGLEK